MGLMPSPRHVSPPARVALTSSRDAGTRSRDGRGRGVAAAAVLLAVLAGCSTDHAEPRSTSASHGAGVTVGARTSPGTRGLTRPTGLGGPTGPARPAGPAGPSGPSDAPTASASGSLEL